MADEYLVMMLVSVVVTAQDKDDAVRKAQLPFQYGALPSVARYVMTGVRPAQLGDRPGESAEADAKFKEAVEI